ncbi:hypothetical protein EG850_04565 [Gulosibacter macacae]|uniref:Uncharacterized protein n=1 Tax=Gulosibacter macacae TaxID=2488791 RepID=A0A3P3VY05_9MICO|nr:hypothetical protein [Gulosibacter macacae]RRJ87580.1 hypothetical protein EG850_04565 [Gulosibacter macacae]
MQLPRHRAAALRVLAAASGVSSPGIGHWALAEATLKALGQAGHRPSRLPLPSELAGELRWEAESGEALAGCVVDLADRLDVPVGTMLAVAWVVERRSVAEAW